LLAAAAGGRYNGSRFHQQKYCHPKWLKLSARDGFEIRAIGAWRSSWKKHWLG
jgi:hypothetical protein